MTVEQIREALKEDRIRYVLLDMDGTLLDKYFDDYFWCHLVPEKYAEKHNITFGKAKEILFAKYRSQEGTLNWTDVDYWSRELDLDIQALKEQIRHLIEVHPGVEDFLRTMNEQGKKVYLVTNAHYKSLTIKMRKTQLGKYFHRVITAFDVGMPKEQIQFWSRLQKMINFQKEQTLFVDDSEDILHRAKDYGIRYILLKKRANSKEPSPSGQRENSPFPSIEDFRELL